MKKSTIRIIALAFMVALAICGVGCNKNDGATTTNTTADIPSVSEIDSVVMSVDTIKSSYDENKLIALQVDDASMQAMVLEGVMDETPDLYKDAEYKTKLANIYNTINAIDLNKSDLAKEDGAEKSFKSLVQIVTRMYNKTVAEQAVTEPSVAQ